MKANVLGSAVLVERGRRDAFGGLGFLGGMPPDAEVEQDGRARILNEPARIDITVFEPNTYTVVARTWSRPDGSWRVPYLNTGMQFTVIGTDRSRQVNSAIQDWVWPAPLPSDQPAPPSLSMLLPAAFVNEEWRGEVRIIGGRTSGVILAGVPEWISVYRHDTGAFLRGRSPSAGVFTIDASAEVGGHALNESGTFVVSPAVIRISAVRLAVTANAGNTGYVSVTELEVRAVPGGPSLCAGGAWFESSSANASNSAFYAFDGSMVNKWSAVMPTVISPQYFGYTFATPVAVGEIAIGGPIVGQLDMAPVDFVVEGLIGGVWTVLFSRNGESGWVASQFKVYPV